MQLSDAFASFILRHLNERGATGSENLRTAVQYRTGKKLGRIFFNQIMADLVEQRLVRKTEKRWRSVYTTEGCGQVSLVIGKIKI